jgi:hypothetical protein
MDHDIAPTSWHRLHAHGIRVTMRVNTSQSCCLVSDSHPFALQSVNRACPRPPPYPPCAPDLHNFLRNKLHHTPVSPPVMTCVMPCQIREETNKGTQHLLNPRYVGFLSELSQSWSRVGSNSDVTTIARSPLGPVGGRCCSPRSRASNFSSSTLWLRDRRRRILECESASGRGLVSICELIEPSMHIDHSAVAKHHPMRRHQKSITSR